jgi:hypothetical protein
MKILLAFMVLLLTPSYVFAEVELDCNKRVNVIDGTILQNVIDGTICSKDYLYSSHYELLRQFRKMLYIDPGFRQSKSTQRFDTNVDNCKTSPSVADCLYHLFNTRRSELNEIIQNAEKEKSARQVKAEKEELTRQVAAQKEEAERQVKAQKEEAERQVKVKKKEAARQIVAKKEEAARQEKEAKYRAFMDSPNGQLLYAFVYYQRVQACYKAQKGYLVVYVTDFEMTDAKNKIKAVQSKLEINLIRNSTTKQLWDQAVEINKKGDKDVLVWGMNIDLYGANVIHRIQTEPGYAQGFCPAVKREFLGQIVEILGSEPPKKDF